MEQMKLAHEQQLAEEKRRLEAEKQAEIERLKQQNQQHQLELKRAQDDLKRQTPVQSPKSTTPPKQEQELKKPTPLTLFGSPPTLTPAPKPVIPSPSIKLRDDREIQSIDQKSLKQLLQYVAEGEQDKAEALIQKDKNLLLHTGTVKDLSDREFKSITAFQYALWAMDWHMWTMIQTYLPQEAQAEQLKELETKGTAYGKHFSLQGLTGTLQTYVDKYSDWNQNQREDHWQKMVGKEQKLLVVHVVNEYCRGDRSFHPCPQEWKSKLPRLRELEMWDSIHSKYIKGSWFISPTAKDDVGVSCAVYRSMRWVPYWAGAHKWGDCTGVNADLKALQSLGKIRTEQLEMLKSQLLSTPSQNQRLEAESKHVQKELKYELPVQPPKSTPPLPPVSQTIAQTILPPPKPKASPAQLALQDQLIAACKQGDEKAVKALLQKGGKTGYRQHQR